MSAPPGRHQLDGYPTIDEYELIQRAALIEGRKIAQFTTRAAVAAADKVIKRDERKKR